MFAIILIEGGMVVGKSIIFHIDVNSAYLSWTAVHRIKNGEKVDIRDMPSVIGGDEKSRRGVVLAKSIKAKELGIITGESLYTARKKCPELLIFPPNFNIYSKCSRELMEFLSKYTPCQEQYSIDECFLDMGVISRKEALKLAMDIKESIKDFFNFTVSIGISENKVLAKMASELKKPDKVNTLYNEEIKDKLWPLKVEELFMVGKKAKEKLNKMYIFTVGDLANYDLGLLQDKFKSYGEMIWKYANGKDDSKVSCENYSIKNISNATTLSYDVRRKEEAHRIIMDIGELVAERLRSEKKYCFSVAINIKNSEFKSYSHQVKLLNPTDSTKVIINTALELFDECWKKDSIRLLGITLSNLTEENIKQLNLFDMENNKINKDKVIDDTVDSIRKKYGRESILRSLSIKSKEK